ncbi:hypothetical protein [Tolypothrix bouteillei]|uniref:hypothetical protein n=1 Tax=Tolypothrix bouteillei TaxID=1246981 RepID=UPI0038B6A259
MMRNHGSRNDDGPDGSSNSLLLPEFQRQEAVIDAKVFGHLEKTGLALLNLR